MSRICSVVVQWLSKIFIISVYSYQTAKDDRMISLSLRGQEGGICFSSSVTGNSILFRCNYRPMNASYLNLHNKNAPCIQMDKKCSQLECALRKGSKFSNAGKRGLPRAPVLFIWCRKKNYKLIKSPCTSKILCGTVMCSVLRYKTACEPLGQSVDCNQWGLFQCIVKLFFM